MAMFIIRNTGAPPSGVTVKLHRTTPAPVAERAGEVDWFCVGDPEAARRAGHVVVALHDGWYADDSGGGVVIYGPYWEIRDTHFSVREVAPDPLPAGAGGDAGADTVNVRKAIFGV